MKAFFRAYWIECVLFLLGLISAVIAFPLLPDSIPMQWRDGEVVSTGSKGFVFLFPALLLVPFAVHGLLGLQMRKLPILQGFDRLLAVLVGAVLGVGGAVFFWNYNPPDDRSLSASTVFGRIVAQNELVSVSYDYCIVDKVSDINRFFDLFDIPFTDNSFWYRYQGTIKAGVSLEDADYKLEENTIRISLSSPYIVANEPDMDASGVLEERNNILNPIHVEDVDAFQAQCIEKSEQEAIEAGLLDEARENAEENIRDMFAVALGEKCAVEFSWREA